MELFEDRIAVRADTSDEPKSGEIIKMRTEQKTRGTVVACGPGQYNALRNEISPMNVKVGDVIIYGKYTGGDIEIDGESLLLMRQCDVIAVVDRAVAQHDCPDGECGGCAGCDCEHQPVDDDIFIPASGMVRTDGLKPIRTNERVLAPNVDDAPRPVVAHIAPRPIDPDRSVVNVNCSDETCGQCPRCCAIYNENAQNLQNLFEDDNADS